MDEVEITINGINERNLFLSTIFRPNTSKVNWNQLSLLIGLSILESLIILV